MQLRHLLDYGTRDGKVMRSYWVFFFFDDYHMDTPSFLRHWGSSIVSLWAWGFTEALRSASFLCFYDTKRHVCAFLHLHTTMPSFTVRAACEVYECCIAIGLVAHEQLITPSPPLSVGMCHRNGARITSPKQAATPDSKRSNAVTQC